MPMIARAANCNQRLGEVLVGICGCSYAMWLSCAALVVSRIDHIPWLANPGKRRKTRCPVTHNIAISDARNYERSEDRMNSQPYLFRLQNRGLSGIALQKKRKGEIMFARHITLQLRPNLGKEFRGTFEKEIVPLLKKQKGFVDELLLVAPEKREIVAISLWETRELAETYHREVYPKVENLVEKYIEGFPVIKNFEEQYATFHKIAMPATV